MALEADVPREEATDASRRTWLAAERTWLAWWRTGLGPLRSPSQLGASSPW